MQHQQQQLLYILNFFRAKHIVLINSNLNFLDVQGFKFIKLDTIQGVCFFSKDTVIGGLDLPIEEIIKYFEVVKELNKNNDTIIYSESDYDISYFKVTNQKDAKLIFSTNKQTI